ncbi:efflux RND transporter permease subunit [Telmatospirillum sp. J64-1]|uniref:efflux RND transporter permease subunit n=1 Tax=Telmatospirillum sp. J64-1 TaxID=2502183 RepID=UPI00115DFF65|nr:efflux RND transporter permease subunit [Telmatospirillum sp. J64-1]
MSFTELFIRRPVLSIVVSLLILLLGLQGISSMQVRQYPEVDETVITITTAYPGASADLIQGFITDPLAKAAATAEGVDYVTSQSAQSLSTVSVHMRLNTDPDKALTEVISKTQQVRRQLPSESEDPIVQKGTGQTFALMYLAFTSDQMTGEQVTEYLTRVIQPRLSTIEGVADAQLLGAKTFAMRVWIDPIRLASRNVTAAEVTAAIQSSNFLAAPGKTENSLFAYSVETNTTLQTPESFGELPIRTNGDEVVRLRDVARVELGSETDDMRVSFDGQEGTFIGIYSTPSANPLDTAAAVQQALPQIQAELPQGMNASIVYDSTTFIDASIHEVFKTIGEAVVIVILVILLFLGSFRSVVIPIVTIPLSLIGVCFFLFLLGYSLNTLTLLAMVLAIGLVVDDAIVVVENIHRHIEEGLSPIQAAITGMKEIFGPVVAMTVTLAAVYAPIGFIQGLTGALFREFAFTLAGAVVISGIIAVTLSPMMSSRLLKPHKAGTGGFARRVDAVFERLSNWYSRRLAGSLNYRPVLFFIVAAMLATTVFLFMKTSSELAPQEDQGALFAMVTAPSYATSDYTQAFVEDFGKVTADIPEVETAFSIVGMGGNTNSGIAIWKFLPWGERDRNAQEMQEDIQSRIDTVAGVQAFVFSPPSLPGSGGGLPVQMVVRSTASPERVYEVAEEIKAKALASGRFIVVQNGLSYETPRARVVIDRDRANALGVRISDIGTTLNVLLSNAAVSKFDRDNRSYDIIPQVEHQDRLNPESLNRFHVRGSGDTMIPLSSVVRIETSAAPAAVHQFNQLNSATLSALPLPGVTLMDGLDVMRDIAEQTMPDGFFLDYAGESRLAVQEGNSIAMAFGLAIIVIYLVLAAQFESFRDPFIIMMSVPLSIFGAMIPLNLGVATLNIYTQVGLITLIGLITKHGILMVEFANQLREEKGLSRRAAIEESAKVRLRPILMTTAAMVLGVSPLLIAEGAGAGARFSIGLVIASGLSIGTLFTLFVVPMFYTMIAKPDPKEQEASPALPDGAAAKA